MNHICSFFRIFFIHTYVRHLIIKMTSPTTIVNEVLDDIKENIDDYQQINEQMEKLNVNCIYLNIR
jgi:tRNA isopentenyl-2-thiomethyl-A-37 hydroxylase MiaE